MYLLIINFFRIFIVILIALLIPYLSSALENNLTTKEQLNQRIITDLEAVQRHRSHYRPSSPVTNSSVLSLRLQQKVCTLVAALREEKEAILYHQYYDVIEQRINRLKILIDQTPEEQLPETMLRRFLKDEKRPHENPFAHKPLPHSEYPQLKLYVFSIGKDIMIPIINNIYNESSSKSREKMLGLLAWFASRQTLPLIKQALNDSSPKVRSQAQIAFSAIFKWLQYKPELKEMLITTTNLWYLKQKPKVIPPYFTITGNKDWYEKFFRLIRNEKASFYDLDLLGDLKDCPEEVVVNNLPFLMTEIVYHHPDSHSYIQIDPLIKHRNHDKAHPKNYLNSSMHLLLNLDKKRYIHKLYPLLTILLHDHYWGGAAKTGYPLGGADYRFKPSPINMRRFQAYQSNTLLKKIASSLQDKDIKKWRKILPYDFLTDLFLQNLLNQKKGIHSDLYRQDIYLNITIINQTNNEILASSKYSLKYDTEETFILPSVNQISGYVITAKARLDYDKWMILTSILIDFKPHGAGFDAYIPIAGSTELSLSVRSTQGKIPTKWVFEHIYKPDQSN